MISAISFSKPTSRDLSYSSSTRVLIFSKGKLSRLNLSAIRPGVPMSMAGRCFRSILSSDPERPPYTAFTLNPDPIFRHTCSICNANSREGTRISSWISSQFGLSVSINGNRNAKVLPVPVGESKITSEFDSIASRASSCIGLSAVIPNLLRIESVNLSAEFVF